MKRWTKIVLTLILSIGILSACSSQESSSAGGLSVKVLSGEFVTPPDKTDRNSKDYLALQFQVTNNTQKSMEIMDVGFFLKSEDEKISPTSVWDSTESFKTFTHATLEAGDTQKGYLVYQVDKKTTNYTLETEVYMSSGDTNKPFVRVAIDTKKYKDDRENLLSVAKEYISGVFLSGSDIVTNDKQSVNYKENSPKTTLLTNQKSSNNLIGNSIEEDREEFISFFVKELTNLGTYYYHPSEDERKKIVLAYMAENAKRAEVDYSLISYLPNVFTVSIKPKVITFTTRDISSLKNDYLDNQDKSSFGDYEEKQKEAEKYAFANLPQQFTKSQVSEPLYMSEEGYRLTFIKDNGKWYLDSASSENYSYRTLKEVFTGSYN